MILKSGNFCFWYPKSRKILLVEPGVLGFGIRNPTFDWIQNFHWQRLESSTWDPESMSLYPESKTVLDSLLSAPETFHAWFPVSVGTDASRRTRFPNMALNMLYVWTFADCFTSRPCPHVYGYFWIREFFFPDSKIPPCTGIRIHSCTQDSSGNIGNRAVHRGCQVWHVN